MTVDEAALQESSTGPSSIVAKAGSAVTTPNPPTPIHQTFFDPDGNTHATSIHASAIQTTSGKMRQSARLWRDCRLVLFNTKPPTSIHSAEEATERVHVHFDGHHADIA